MDRSGGHGVKTTKIHFKYGPVKELKMKKFKRPTCMYIHMYVCIYIFIYGKHFFLSLIFFRNSIPLT